jgi:D-alanyl-D-alanine carboxypeptidase
MAQAELQQWGMPGMTVALAKKGTILYAQGYGVTDLSSQQPTNPKTIFEIGSITKQFTAALVMRLQEQGRVHVDDTVVTYLPEYGFSPAITIRMLLSHTSGLADFTNFPDLGQWVRHGISESAALREISQAGLQFPPGSKYAYSNSNFFLLGSVIEKLTGQPYAENLKQSIFQPLALQSTYYALPPANVAATGYFNDGTGLVPSILWNRSAAFAAGALSTNVYDLAKWDEALLSGSVVSPASFQQMTTSNGFFQNGFSYGFGLQLSTYSGRRIMWHTGQIGGFTAENAVFLDNAFTVIVLTNDQDYDTDQFVLKLLNAVCGSSQLSGNC